MMRMRNHRGRRPSAEAQSVCAPVCLPVTGMASVEEAEAYAAQHAIAARLEAALNACLAALPAKPFPFLASHLRESECGYRVGPG